MIKDVMNTSGEITGTVEYDETKQDMLTDTLNIFDKIPKMLVDQAWQEIRNEREALFSGTQWVRQRHEDETRLGLPFSLSDQQLKDWLLYWKSLRALPQTYSSPFMITWPTKPSSSATAVTAARIVQAKIAAAKNFGETVIEAYGANNVLRGMTTAQVKQIKDQLLPIQLSIASGSLYVALFELSQLQPSELLLQSDIDFFVAKIQTYLGII